MHTITNDLQLDKIKDNYKAPRMTEIEFETAEEVIFRLDLNYKEFKKYIYYNGEVLDNKYYWTKELCDFIKREDRFLSYLLQRFNDYEVPLKMTAEEVRDLIIRFYKEYGK